MGQYIKFKNQEVKIGTCENCYYITFQQMKANAHKMQDIGDGSPESYLKVNSGYRFRFPFVDELKVEPFTFSEFKRGFLFQVPKHIGIEIHHEKIFTRIGFQQNNTHDKEAGISVPCPQSEDFDGRRWHNEGVLFIEFTQQKYVISETTGLKELQTVARCPYCGASSRLSKQEVESMLNYYKELQERETMLNSANKEFKPSYLVHIQTLEISLQGYNNYNN